jgi:hypothetical protein
MITIKFCHQEYDIKFDRNYSALLAILSEDHGLARECANIFYSDGEDVCKVTDQYSFEKFVNSGSTELSIVITHPTTPPREKQKTECPWAPRGSSNATGFQSRIAQPDFV